MKIHDKQQLIKLVKQKHLMKTFIITTYALINRNFGTTHDEVIQKLIKFYPTDEKLIIWLKQWQNEINHHIKMKIINFNNLQYHKIFI